MASLKADKEEKDKLEAELRRIVTAKKEKK